VRDGSRPTAIVDIDHTLSTAGKWQVIRGDLEAPPLEGSPAILAEVMQHYEIVYVTARIKKFQRYTRAWLAKHGFSRRPIFFMDFKKYPTYDEAQYKIDTIGPIRELFPNTVVGFGDKKTDAVAYRHHGLRTFILGDAGGVDGAEEVADWAEIRQLLLGTRAQAFRRLHGVD
jgi:phosphatidate phosphatase PAH1